MFRVYNCNAKNNMKCYIYREKQEKFPVGTVHYENPLADQFVEIDQHGCLLRSLSTMDSNSVICAQKASPQQETFKICDISKQSTKQEITISLGKQVDNTFIEHQQNKSAFANLNKSILNKPVCTEIDTKMAAAIKRGKIKKQPKQIKLSNHHNTRSNTAIKKLKRAFK